MEPQRVLSPLCNKMCRKLTKARRRGFDDPENRNRLLVLCCEGSLNFGLDWRNEP